MTKSVRIIVPIYKSELSVLELQSLTRTYSVMHKYPITVIKPSSLDLSCIKEKFSRITFESFDDSFFCGVAGYNKLMLSTLFYDRFSDTDYILICQLDVFIFQDKLASFLEKDYDYIGAPWLKRRLYRYLPFVEKIKTSKKRYDRSAITWEQNSQNRIGNGGFSLRKVKSCYDAAVKYADRIRVYNARQGTSLYNEDTFWSKELFEFKYPTVEEALEFSFDKYPGLCYIENNKNLPMGCHGWYKWKNRTFWKRHIKFDE